MKLQIIIFILLSIFCSAVSASPAKDKRLAAISSSELHKLILQTPLASSLQEELFWRAHHAHLMGEAYTQYTTLWQQEPNNAYVNLLRGMSAEYLEWDRVNPELEKLYKPYTQRNLLPTAGFCLEKAVKLLPASSVANTEYGFFLWQFGNDLPKGITQLKKALRLAPDDAHVHETWGLIYSNPATKDYNMPRAVEQLELATKLDPAYALPHELLANIYTRLNQPNLATIEHTKYQKMIP